jgi:hypothetical protein
MVLNITFLILGILGALSIVVYLTRYLTAPRLFCRVAGEQSGEPIPLVAIEGSISFAIGTTTKRGVELLLVSVSATDEVEIRSKDGERVLTRDHDFPFAVEFRDSRELARGHLQGLSVSYRAAASSFQLKIRMLAALKEEDLGFLLDMFSPRKVKRERIVRFRVDPSLKLTLQQSGLVLRPGEAVQVQGKQAQDAFWAAADKEGSQVLVRELLDDGDGGKPNVPRK